MTKPTKTKPDAGGRRASEVTTARASDSGTKHTPQQATALSLALAAIDEARAQLASYALVTDTPARGVVETADLLDEARACLPAPSVQGP